MGIVEGHSSWGLRVEGWAAGAEEGDPVPGPLDICLGLPPELPAFLLGPQLSSGGLDLAGDSKGAGQFLLGSDLLGEERGPGVGPVGFQASQLLGVTGRAVS